MLYMKNVPMFLAMFTAMAGISATSMPVIAAKMANVIGKVFMCNILTIRRLFVNGIRL